MGGFRTLAQYLTLAENPQIRFADLMDGRKYTAEKQAAATRLADALEKMYAPKEGTAAGFESFGGHHRLLCAGRKQD